MKNSFVRYGALLLTMLCVVIKSNASENQYSVTEQDNLKKALYCIEVLENRPDMQIAKRLHILRNQCFASGYIQHSPHVPDGREAVLNLFEKRFKKYPELTSSIKRVAADGDLVWIHQHVKREPNALGRAVINIFKMKDGKFIEHWNVGQAVPKKAKNNNGMF